MASIIYSFSRISNAPHANLLNGFWNLKVNTNHKNLSNFKLSSIAAYIFNNICYISPDILFVGCQLKEARGIAF